MLRADDAFEQLLSLAYDAPLHRDGWEPFLRALQVFTGSRAVCLRWLALDTGESTMVGAGLEPDAVTTYLDRFARSDPWTKVPVAPGDDVFGAEMLPRRTLESSSFYVDYCTPHAIRDIHKTVLSRDADRVQSSLGIFKEASTSPDPDERNLTRRLVPHLQRALALKSRHATIEDARGALETAVDHDPAGVFFLDARTRVKFCNRAGERIVGALDGLTLAQRTLRAAHPADHAALCTHLALVCSRGRTGEHDDPGPILVGRISGRAPYHALAVPLHRRHEDLSRAGIAALLFVNDPECVPTRRVSAATLRSLYGLTPAEARVASLVGRGMSPRAAAERLDVSWHTVRAQLREVFAKTGAQRQSALVELLARLDAVSRLP